MPSSYTTNIGLEKIATGEQDGTWGDTVNYNMDMVDTAINGSISITLAGTGTTGAPNTLDITDGTIDEGLNQYITITDGGDLGGNVYVQLTPNDAEKICFIRNSLSGSQDLYLFQGTYDAGRDYVLAAGKTAVVSFSGGGASASTVSEVVLAFDPADPGAIGGTTPAAGTFTTFTSNGIDDNATAEVLQLADNLLTLGTANTAMVLVHADTDASVAISGGSTADLGANLVMYGEAHATLADDIQFRGSGVTQLYYNDSTSSWDFQANSITTSGTITAASDILLASGSITSTSGAISFGNENLSTTGALTCGTFTSTGIDDNATAERLQLADSLLTLGTAGAGYSINHAAADQTLTLWGGSLSGSSAVQLYGDSHATNASDIILRGAAGAAVAQWDHSASAWDFKANDITTTGTIAADSITLINGLSYTDSGVVNFQIGSSTGTDIPINFNHPTANYDWVIGVDNSDAGSFGIYNSASLGTTPFVIFERDTSTANFQANDITTTGYSYAERVYLGATQLGDSNLWMGANSSDSALINFDGGDFLKYDRTINNFQFWIGSIQQFKLNATSADFLDNDITTTGNLTSGLHTINSGNQDMGLVVNSTDTNVGISLNDATTTGVNAEIALRRTGNDLQLWTNGSGQLVIDGTTGDANFQANNITTTGDLTCAGFTSTGIDDNATGERLQIADTEITVGGSAATVFSISRDVTNQTLIVSGGSSPNLGSNVILYGEANAQDRDIVFRQDTTAVLRFNYQGGVNSYWDFQDNAISWNYTTQNKPFFDFVATADADATSAISTLTTSGATTHHIQVEINGTKAWIAVSTNNPS